MSDDGSVNVRPYGDRAFLLEFDDIEQVVAHHGALVAAIAGTQLMGVRECVPAARTILVHVDGTRPLDEVVSAVRAVEPLPPAAREDAPTIELPMRYDGPDLEVVAAAVGLDVAAFVREHSARTWTAAFTGFAPGFAYLVTPQGWEVPRRDTPRTAVPAGAVAMAGPFTGIYPRRSPAGWQIIGHTDAVLWDLERQPPALLPTGHRVRFVATP